MKELKSSFDVSEYLKYCAQKKKQIFTELEKNRVDLIGVNKNDKKILTHQLKNQLKELKIRVDGCLDLIEDCTTFEREPFLAFLRGYLSLAESKKYCQLEFVEEHGQIALISSAVIKEEHNISYDIVTTEENYENIFINPNTRTVKRAVSICEDGKYVCLERKNKFTLLNGSKLSKEFASYPYLANVATQIVDLRLANPEMNERDILRTILTELYEIKKVK